VIQQDSALAQDIRVVAIAVADNQTRADDYKIRMKMPFPIFPDEKGDIYMAWNQPMIPSILLTTTSGKVLMHHDGLIKEFDELVEKIKKSIKEQ
jgi:hypothetical protein